jgi:hypothetical protein
MGKSSWDYPREVQTKLKGKKVWMAEYAAETEKYTPRRGTLRRVVIQSPLEPLYAGIAMDDNPEVETLENIYYVFPDKKTAEQYIDIQYQQFELDLKRKELSRQKDYVQDRLRALIESEYAM